MAPGSLPPWPGSSITSGGGRAPWCGRGWCAGAGLAATAANALRMVAGNRKVPMTPVQDPRRPSNRRRVIGEQGSMEVNDGELFAFAGLWDGWKDSIGKWVKTCSILTTTPNAVTSAVHDRMPAILDSAHYDLWLDPGMQDVTAISQLLKPYDACPMRCYPVSTRVNNVVNDDAECSQRVEFSQTQDRLFS